MRHAFLPRVLWTVLGLCVLLCYLPACTGSEPDVIKIGLVAPFEGDKRYLGYDAIYAARLAIREINNAGGINGIPVELVAYDDRASSDMAADAVRNLAADPQVVAVVGHYYDVTSSVLALYAQYELPVLLINSSVNTESQRKDYHFHVASDAESMQLAYDSLDNQNAFVDYRELSEVVDNEGAEQDLCTITPYPYPQDVPGTEAWIADYLAVGPHVPAPGMMALVTYDAIKALAQTMAEHSAYDRESALNAIMDLDYDGYLGHIMWREGTQYWVDAPLYYYCWHDGQWILEYQLSGRE